MLTGIDHLVVAVPDLETAIARDTPEARRGPFRDWLRTRGPSPYSAVLRTASGEARRLDEAKTLGAQLRLEPA